VDLDVQVALLLRFASNCPAADSTSSDPRRGVSKAVVPDNAADHDADDDDDDDDEEEEEILELPASDDEEDEEQR
jgi:hypothetical protein